MRVNCPKHKNENLQMLRYAVADKKIKNKRQGLSIKTEWYYCVKCDKPYKIVWSFK